MKVLDALQLGGSPEAPLIVCTPLRAIQEATFQSTAASSVVRGEGKLLRSVIKTDMADKQCASSSTPYCQPWYMHSNILAQPLLSATGAALCRHTCTDVVMLNASLTCALHNCLRMYTQHQLNIAQQTKGHAMVRASHCEMLAAGCHRP